MRYGCVSPTPEMEDVDHSDSEFSDASFEIVSAEGIDDSQTIPPSFKPCIKFHDIFDVYPMDADVVARISTSGDFKISSDDKVVVVPLAWSSVDQAVCVSKLNGLYVRFDVNELPKAPADQFYQLCYCTAEGSIVGVSTPFFFREVHEEDLMEFQKEQNKEFWTFRSRFAVLTDLYWNAVKSNGTTRPDEMTGSCGATKDSETTEKSFVESCNTSNNAESIDKSPNESTSSIQVSVTSEKSVTEDCSANKASEVIDESSNKNRSVTDASETTEKSVAEDGSVIKDSESAEKTPGKTENEDPVQPEPACVNPEPTIDNQNISENSDKEQNNPADQMESKPVTKSMDNSAVDGGALKKSDNDRAKRFMDVGPWKLRVNDSFYNGNQYSMMGQGAPPLDNSANTTGFPTLERRIQDLGLSTLEKYYRLHQIQQFGEYNTNKDNGLMQLTIFRALPESIVGRLLLEAMNCFSVDRLEKDLLLCEARRHSRYHEVQRRTGGNSRMNAPNHTKEPVAPVSKTILSLTSRIESQAALMQDLRMQLANETKTINALKVEYLSYKRDMETRLKHCAKIYAKMSLKLRHISNEARK